MSDRSIRCRWPPVVQTRAINLTSIVESVGRSVLASTAVLSMKHFWKSSKPPLQNITQLRLMNQAPGLVAHRVEVVAQSAGGRQFQPQMLKPKFERHRLLRQQAGVLVFAATVETAQHQENINDIGFGAGPAYLQFDLIELEHTQLKLQLGQIRRLARQELCVDQAQQLFPFGVQVQILVDALHDGGLKAG